MSKKLAALTVLLAVSVFYSYATLGELGRRVNVGGDRPLLTNKKAAENRSFSLKSGYNFRGNQVFRLQEEKINVIELNTVMSYRMGGSTYITPMNRKVAVNLTSQNKVSSATVKINL